MNKQKAGYRRNNFRLINEHILQQGTSSLVTIIRLFHKLRLMPLISEALVDLMKTPSITQPTILLISNSCFYDIVYGVQLSAHFDSYTVAQYR